MAAATAAELAEHVAMSKTHGAAVQLEWSDGSCAELGRLNGGSRTCAEAVARPWSKVIDGSYHGTRHSMWSGGMRWTQSGVAEEIAAALSNSKRRRVTAAPSGGQKGVLFRLPTLFKEALAHQKLHNQ